MGYSISVRFKNEKDKKRMLAFFDSQKTLVEKLVKSDRSDFPLYFQEKENLGYAPNLKHLLGFNFITTPYYAWALCSWMAVKSEYSIFIEIGGC